MADRILKPDSGNDLVLQNNGGTAKIEINDGQEISISIGSSSGDDFNVGSGKLLIEGDTSLVSITGDFKVGGNNIEDSGGVVCFTFDGSGNTDMADKILQRPTIKDYGESVNAIGNTGGGGQSIDLTLGNVVTATQTVSETTYTFDNPSAIGKCCSFTFILTNGASNSGTAWPASVDWAGGTEPTLTASGIDIFSFLTIDGGTIWYGFTGAIDTKTPS